MPQFINNTISENSISYPISQYGGGIFVDWGTCQGYNNIVYGNSATNGADCYGNVSFTYSCSGTLLSGTGNIAEDPLFINPASEDFHLQAGSPCIDTGDPSSPLDPDSTRADMGALYFDQSQVSPVTVTLAPYGAPIQIPASGGSFDFNIEVANSEANPETFDIWTMATLPNGSEYGPIINVPGFTAPANWSANRDRTQVVPGEAPMGMYTYDAYVGVYPDDVWDEDHFDFEKLTTGDGSTILANWECWGESFENRTGLLLQVPEKFVLLGAHPNPFNLTTTLSFELPDENSVKLEVFDLSGRRIAELVNGWREAGIHEVTFDGSELASGVYIYCLQASDFTASRKMLLVK